MIRCYLTIANSLKKRNKIADLIEWLQLNSKVGWGVVHISWFSDGEFIEGWRVNFDNKFYEALELYNALIKAKQSLK